MTRERDRMLAGESYDSRDAELLAVAHRARALLAELSGTASTEGERRQVIVAQLLGNVDEEVWIEPPFFCDYGENVFIGARTFVNINCVFLDSAEIRIGEDVLIGPGVQLLTPTHPLRSSERIVPAPERRAGTSSYRTRALPIRIGDRVWIGAGALVMPGVSIGDDTTIGAGSIVTADIPANVLAFGQPCRVQRPL